MRQEEKNRKRKKKYWLIGGFLSAICIGLAIFMFLNQDEKEPVASTSTVETKPTQNTETKPTTKPKQKIDLTINQQDVSIAKKITKDYYELFKNKNAITRDQIKQTLNLFTDEVKSKYPEEKDQVAYTNVTSNFAVVKQTKPGVDLNSFPKPNPMLPAPEADVDNPASDPYFDWVGGLTESDIEVTNTELNKESGTLMVYTKGKYWAQFKKTKDGMKMTSTYLIRGNVKAIE
ncbi:hypothetical protein [Bacillus cereus]|uniref:Uncharacterized protein n=1 Tax=Bacillus cereus (strain VD146) TaxID=1053236 RepID=R8MEX3_BACCX|nr:hypothetical protein [Bacillus cereus]EOP32303.1 hypothetical protein IK1_05839 [Bacillus cereus VD146]